MQIIKRLDQDAFKVRQRLLGLFPCMRLGCDPLDDIVGEFDDCGNVEYVGQLLDDMPLNHLPADIVGKGIRGRLRDEIM
jgi:hypothetical protein